MKESRIFYIYKITILKGELKNYYYIGKRVHRVNRHDNYYGSGVIIRRWFNKEERIEGIDFKKEILCYCNNKEELALKEKEYIGNKYNLDPFCLNLKAGGDGGPLSIQSINKMKDTINNDDRHIERCRNNGKKGASKQSKLKKGNKKYAEIAKENAIKGGPKAAKTRKKLYKEHPELIERMIYNQKNKPIEELNRINYERGSSGRDTIWIKHEVLQKNKRIKIEELSYYKSIGWEEGRIKYNNNISGSFYMTDGIVKPTLVITRKQPDFIARGYYRCMGRNNKAPWEEKVA